MLHRTRRHGASPGPQERHRGLAGLLLFLLASTLAASSERQAALARFGDRQRGVRYSFGTCNAQRMDCSCLARKLYRDVFDMDIPRTTLAQAAALAPSRVTKFRDASSLRARDLCVGDLIYTHQGPSWNSGSRHVTIYAGGGKLLHAWRGGNRVGTSPLSWLRPFRLHGVYRPLGCGASTDAGERPRGRLVTTSARDEALVRAVIAEYFSAWPRGSVRLRRAFWADAVQVQRGSALGVDELVAAHRHSLADAKRVSVDYRFESLAFWGDLAIVEVVYDLEVAFASHDRTDKSRRETLLLQRRGTQWRISHRDVALGD